MYGIHVVSTYKIWSDHWRHILNGMFVPAVSSDCPRNHYHMVLAVNVIYNGVWKIISAAETQIGISIFLLVTLLNLGWHPYPDQNLSDHVSDSGNLVEPGRVQPWDIRISSPPPYPPNYPCPANTQDIYCNWHWKIALS